ncbi:MAG: hypothetical protein ABI947_26675 [Chloroflexota bacterium]
MSRFNLFVVPIECPHCGNKVKVRFQASIGALDLIDFIPGDQVIDIPAEVNPPIFGDGPNDHTIDFWTYGLGNCPICQNYIWGKVNIRSKIFESVTLIQDEPDDMYGWGLL